MVGTDVPWCTTATSKASIEVFFGYELIALGLWNCGAPSYSISSGIVIGK